MTLPFLRAFTPAFRALFAVLLIAANCETALAQSKEIKLTGMGIRKCAEWQQWKEARNTESRAMALEWAQGFIAGHNVYARGGSAGSVVASVSVLIPLLDAYCKGNPDERILAGVVEITRELGGSKVDLAPRSPSPAPPPARKDEKGRQDS